MRVHVLVKVNEVQHLECCDLTIFLYAFQVYSTLLSTLIIEVLNINRLVPKLNCK